MSANYFDLLKYAATGQASPSMTYFAKMRASTLMGGVVQTLTGQPPLTFKADGTPLISWSMKGNGSQTGTPTPDAPIMPEFVGVRTGNLFDKNSDTINNHGQVRPGVTVYSGTYSINNTTDRAVYYRVENEGATVQVNAGRKAENISANGVLYVWRDNNVRTDGVMLNSGSTALPYEPFGWAEKITCAGQTVPVYLGQTQTVRRIKKLVLTGEETYVNETAYNRFYTEFPNAKIQGLRLTPVYCTHFLPVYDGRPLADVPNNSIYSGDVASNKFYINTTEYATTADFKSYLAAQYAAGTPVTVWYVLAEAQTAIVNEPLCKIGDYADELHSTDAAVTIPTSKGANTLTVDTPIQPSEMSITYKG